MALNKDFEELFHHLNTANTKYLVVGAYAVIFYTEPRYTKDVNLWIKPDPENAKKVYQALKRFGAPLRDLSVEDLCNPEMVYQLGIAPNRIDILMDIGGTSFEKAWKSKKVYHYGKEKLYIIDLANMIRSKKAAGRLQDQLDLGKLLKVGKKGQTRKIKRKT